MEGKEAGLGGGRASDVNLPYPPQVTWGEPEAAKMIQCWGEVPRLYPCMIIGGPELSEGRKALTNHKAALFSWGDPCRNQDLGLSANSSQATGSKQSLIPAQFSSVQSLSHVRLFATHEPQHARPPCPSPVPRVYPHSSPLSRWCHPTISSSVIPFSRPQLIPVRDWKCVRPQDSYVEALMLNETVFWGRACEEVIKVKK